MKTRVDPGLFGIPIHEIRIGYRSAVYFQRAKRILEKDNHHPVITEQVFQKNDNVIICGVDEAVAAIRHCAGFYSDYDRAGLLFNRYLGAENRLHEAELNRDPDQIQKLKAERSELAAHLDQLWVDKSSEIEMKALRDGDPISSYETVMLIEGDYSYFAHLESIYLGILARRTRLATNSRKVVQAAAGKPVMFFADRFDHHANQSGDGYAAKIGGIDGVASDAMVAWFDEKGIGTIPHALIVAYGGDTVLATRKFQQYMPDVPVISLVDFENDCVRTSLESARALGEKLWGVRLDTARDLIDHSIEDEEGISEEDRYGVSPALVEKTRSALDKEGFNHVRIIVSGGFNPDRIHHFEELKTPVDIYAVGSWMVSGRYEFTADAVRLNGKNLAKVGREYQPNPRLQNVEFE